MRSEYLPRRVVSLQPSATVTLDRLGLLDRVVACTKYCEEVCEGVQQLDPLIISDSWTTQAEQILSARPDLVIASVPYQIEAVGEILKAGVRFLGLAPRTLNDIYSDIMAIAGVMGEAEGGVELVNEMRSSITRVRAKTAGAPRVRVFCEEWGKPIIHSQPWVRELVEAAGGEFVGEAGKHTTADAVRDVAPEVIVAAWCGAGDRVPLEKIVREREWQGTPAGRSGRVYCISDPLLNTPANTLLGGLQALCWAIHPELFPAVAGVRRIGEAVVK
jgi:iron complex transport system substrate-binding protein